MVNFKNFYSNSICIPAIHLHIYHSSFLPDKWEHARLPLVSLSKLLPVSGLLLFGPHHHLNSRNKPEENRSPVTSAEDHNRNPGQALKKIVRAGNHVEAVSAGNLPLSAAIRGAEVAEGHVSLIVRKFGKHPKSNGTVNNVDIILRV